MSELRRFRIEFSGKSFPDRYPHVVTIRAPSEGRAKEWSKKQLEAWKLDPERIRAVVTEHISPPKEAPKQKPKQGRRKGKKRGSI